MKLFFSLMFLFLTSCTGLPKDLIQPKVDLKAVDVQNASFTDATLVFNFLVQNPNAVAISVDKVNYALSLNGKPFTNGVLEKGLKVEGNSSTTVPVSVPFKYTDLSSTLTALLGQGTTPYEIQGAVKMGFFSVPFNQKGDLKLSDLQK